MTKRVFETDDILLSQLKEYLKLEEQKQKIKLEISLHTIAQDFMIYMGYLITPWKTSYLEDLIKNKFKVENH
jgi:hypothetical protein